MNDVATRASNSGRIPRPTSARTSVSIPTAARPIVNIKGTAANRVSRPSCGTRSKVLATAARRNATTNQGRATRGPDASFNSRRRPMNQASKSTGANSRTRVSFTTVAISPPLHHAESLQQQPGQLRESRSQPKCRSPVNSTATTWKCADRQSSARAP